MLKYFRKTNKNRNTKNKTRKNKKRRTGGASKITEIEINKCNDFCGNAYLKEYEKKFRNTLKTNPYIGKPKTDAEIDELWKNANKNEITNECKRTYCNPKCVENGKNTASLRYVCPVCEKRFPKAKKMGAITFCKGDDTLS